MWPEIYRKNNIGVAFDPNFWKNWGPTYMVYFHPDLFKDKKINSIYCLWQPFTTIEFNKEDIAMVLEYACGEFGEHCTFFSYKDVPDIEHLRCEDYYVLPTFETLEEDVLTIYNGILMKKNKEELYIAYLEDHLFTLQALSFRQRNKLQDTLELKLEEYQDYLEKAIALVSQIPTKSRIPIIKKLYDFSKLPTIISCLETEYPATEKKPQRDQFEKKYERYNSPFLNNPNDLNSIFQYARDQHLERAMQYREKEVPEITFDPISKKLVQTEKMTTVFETTYGSVGLENGIATFKEKKRDYSKCL